MFEADVMALGAHPDDIELGCGGTLIKLCDMGYRVVMVDMTRGEMGTRGTSEIRQAEARAAAKIIGAVARENLELEDGFLRTSKEGKHRIVQVIRRYRPKLVFLPYGQDRHPDHYHASALAYEGIFMAGLAQYKTDLESHRPSRIIYYMGGYEFEPSFIVDITAQFERKMEAILAFSTQFRPDDGSYRQTRLTSPEFHWKLEHRMAYYGSLIGVKYGEAFIQRGTLRVENPFELQFSTF